MRIVILVLGAVMLAGCQLYWAKPGQTGATMQAFENDHRDCITTAGTPPGSDRVYVNLDVYRACLKDHGWQRETSGKFSVPVGYFRGQENEGPVQVGELPKQVPSDARTKH